MTDKIKTSLDFAEEYISLVLLGGLSFLYLKENISDERLGTVVGLVFVLYAIRTITRK